MIGIPKRIQPEIRALCNWQRTHEGDFTWEDMAAGMTKQSGIKFTVPRVKHLNTWTVKFHQKFYKKQDELGLLKGNPTQKWIVSLENMATQFNGLTPYFQNKVTRDWGTMPKFSEKQKNSQHRVNRWVLSGQTVLTEMSTYHEEILITGKAPDELLEDFNRIQKKISDGSMETCPTCGDVLEPHWVSCPTCGQPIEEK